MSKYFFILSLAFASVLQAKEFTSSDQIVKKLSAYQLHDLTGDIQRLKNKESLKIDEMFDDLEAAAKFLEGKTPSEDVAYHIERVCLLTFLHDPTSFAVDLTLSTYEKNKSIFEKAAKKLHNYDMQVILEVYDGKSGALKNSG
ncbi:MAG: hypothetical protein IPM97_11190 [Bdellovibrionaceae bacterium]|nr:hypothetical protein [Pseudobdellovibrionaceae bacterium]